MRQTSEWLDLSALSWLGGSGSDVVIGRTHTLGVEHPSLSLLFLLISQFGLLILRFKETKTMGCLPGSKSSRTMELSLF